MLKSAVVAVMMFTNTGDGLVVEAKPFNDYASCHKWISQYESNATQFDRFCMDKKLFDDMKVRHLDVSKNADDVRKNITVN